MKRPYIAWGADGRVAYRLLQAVRSMSSVPYACLVVAPDGCRPRNVRGQLFALDWVTVPDLIVIQGPYEAVPVVRQFVREQMGAGGDGPIVSAPAYKAWIAEFMTSVLDGTHSQQEALNGH